jgi:hypothetical protein
VTADGYQGAGLGTGSGSRASRTPAPTLGGFTNAGFGYLLRHAIEPELAAELGVREERGELVYPYDGFKRRRPLAGSRTLQPARVPLRLWWPTGRPAPGADVLLCEGEPDALAALTALAAVNGDLPVKVPVVAAIPGTGIPAARVVEELRGSSSVTLAMDGDPAGRKCAATLTRALRDAGIAALAIELPEGKDLADLLAASEAPGQALAGLLADAEVVADTDGEPLSIVTLEEFVATEEQGAAPVVGDADGILIAEGSDAMVYGDGGAGKTTLTVDLGFHIAAGDSWLGIDVPQQRRVLVIENEGPRPLFREKLKRKLEGWQGGPTAGRVMVFEHPWARVTFAEEEWRAKLADFIREREIDVVIAGPLTRLGMDAAGTLQDVREFMDLIADMRARSGRLLTVILVHHENKGGEVSGAWEGGGDTLLHVQAAGNGHTIVSVQKARWDSERHGRTMLLAWTDGDSFRLEGDRDYLAEIRELLADGKWRTVKEIAAPEDEGGIGAGEKVVKETLNEHPEQFESRTGDDARAVGRHPSATVWQVRSGSNAPDSPSGSSGGAEGEVRRCVPLKGRTYPERTPTRSPEGASNGSTHPTQTDPQRELDELDDREAGDEP